jgi:alpha-amylase
MASVCLYFQVHQPYRLRRFTYLDRGTNTDYFDAELNRSIIHRAAHKCYLPSNRLLLELIEQHNGRLRLAFSFSGVVLEQMREYCPEALQSFRNLVKTGAVEVLAETYHHSLASFLDPSEFAEQIKLHREVVEREFGVSPRIFRNTELIYSDSIGQQISCLGFRGVLAEAVPAFLLGKDPCRPYTHPKTALPILLKNYELSDDIAFRFSHRVPEGSCVTARSFVEKLRATVSNGAVAGLFLDYETFGEHHWEHTGIFEFLKELPTEVLRDGAWDFRTPSEVLSTEESWNPLSYPTITSWADTQRDVSAWCGNSLQKKAVEAVTRALDGVNKERLLVSREGRKLLSDWRRLQTSDHFYYMSTKRAGDGAVHAYFSPYETPYDAFIYFMNVMRDFEGRVSGAGYVQQTDKALEAVGQ